jgi:hypothetical protein
MGVLIILIQIYLTKIEYYFMIQQVNQSIKYMIKYYKLHQMMMNLKNFIDKMYFAIQHMKHIKPCNLIYKNSLIHYKKIKLTKHTLH